VTISTGILLAFVLVAAVPSAHAAGGRLAVIAAENFYGDVARQIGGDRVAVMSILNNPDQDPHLFETTATVARGLADARIVIYNGANYDAWMDKLLSASPRSDRIAIVAATLVNKKAGDNPHLWYDPATMPSVAKALTAALSKADPAHAADYTSRLKVFLASLDGIDKKIAQLRAKYSGTPVTATEPVFGYMAQALGLTMRNESFQRATMNDTEPSAKDIAAFENDLTSRTVRLVLYNKQVTGKLTQRIIDVARKARVPVVGITETEPDDTSYQDWMLGQLGAVETALATVPQ